MAFGIFKGVSVIVGPLIAAALHPSKSSSPTRGGHGAGGWGGYGFTGMSLVDFSGVQLGITLHVRHHNIRRKRYGGNIGVERCVRFRQTPCPSRVLPHFYPMKYDMDTLPAQCSKVHNGELYKIESLQK